MNKSTKIRLNYLIGIAVSAVLLGGIYLQVTKQLARVDAGAWWQTGPQAYLWWCGALMLLNLALEGKKWQMLAGSAEPLSYARALASCLAGAALSIITPNRLGDYPGRIMYLRRQNTFRLISVSVLGSFAQLLTIFIYGTAALTYYCVKHPGPWWPLPALVASGVLMILLFWCYWRFESWLPLLNKIKWLQKYKIYAQLLMRFSPKEQLTILCISLLRFGIFTAQYLVVLYWMKVQVPVMDGFFLSALFFWVIAVVPSIALAELGVRGQVGLFLFGMYSANTIGILSATVGIWLINLVVPAVAGSLLLLRMKTFR